MDIQIRKLAFIEEFIKINSMDSIFRLESLLNEEKSKSENTELSPMTMEEFNKRIDESMEDSKNNRLTESNVLISEIKEWS